MRQKKPKRTPKQSKGGHKRRATKYAGMYKQLHPRSRRDYIDADYVSTLSNEDKAFYSKFIDEYYGATLASAKKKWRWKNDFHKTPKERKTCTDRNNAQNRDIFAIKKHELEEATLKKIDKALNSPEDALIEIIDILKNEKL